MRRWLVEFEDCERTDLQFSHARKKLFARMIEEAGLYRLREDDATEYTRNTGGW